MKRELQQKTKGDKNHIPPWKKWILILLIIQTFVNIQNYQAQRLMWDSIHDTNRHLNQMQQAHVDYQGKINQLLEQIRDYLKAD